MALEHAAYGRDLVDYLKQSTPDTTLFSNFQGDFALAVGFAIFFPTLRYVLDRLLYRVRALMMICCCCNLSMSADRKRHRSFYP